MHVGSIPIVCHCETPLPSIHGPHYLASSPINMIGKIGDDAKWFSKESHQIHPISYEEGISVYHILANVWHHWSFERFRPFSGTVSYLTILAPTSLMTDETAPLRVFRHLVSFCS